MMTLKQQIDAMVRVQDLALRLGLHGVVVLSPVCPKCGACHTWHLVADIPGDEATAVLRHFGEVCAELPGTIIGDNAGRSH